jgi:hypothetical protein
VRKAATNSEFKVRAARLHEIRAELQQVLNYTDEQVIGAVKERIALAAALRLQHEIEMARMLQGLPVATDALVKLTESIASILPKPASPPMVVTLVNCWDAALRSAIDAAAPGDKARTALEGALSRLTVAEAELKQAKDAATAAERELTRVRAQTAPAPESASAPRRAAAAAGADNVVPLGSGSSGTDWSALGMAVSPQGPYLPPDKFDASGRRLDADGLPASRRQEPKDGAAA